MDQVYTEYPSAIDIKQNQNVPLSRLRLNNTEDDALLMILMLSLMLSVMLPLCMIAAPFILQDSSTMTFLIFLIFLGPGIMLSSSNIRHFLTDVLSNN